MGKLYPDDLGDKIITRTDIDFVILIKERKENPNWSVIGFWQIFVSSLDKLHHFSVSVPIFLVQRIMNEQTMKKTNTKLLLTTYYHHPNDLSFTIKTSTMTCSLYSIVVVLKTFRYLHPLLSLNLINKVSN